MSDEKTTGAGPVDRAFVEDFSDRWLDAWNAHDPARVVALMSSEIVYDDSAASNTMHGREEAREFLKQTWRAFPDMHIEAIDSPFLHIREPKAAFYWRAPATHAPTGKRITFEGGDFHEYRDGELVGLRIVFDMADVLRQLGVLPENTQA